MNDDKVVCISISSDAYITSILPQYVQGLLEAGMKDSFKNKIYEDGCLNLERKDIHDGMMPQLCEGLIKLEGKVKGLFLTRNDITSTGASMLFDMLKATNSSIKEIDLNENYLINGGCMESLGEYIKSNKSIERVDMSCTRVSDASIEILVPYLDGNTTFKRLFLFGSNSGITDKSIPLLLKMIESSHIGYFNVYCTSITKKNIIVVSLASNTFKYRLEKLDLSQNDLNGGDMIKICDMMKKYGIDKLKEIKNSFGSNNITSKGASILFGTLRECNSVVSKLSLSDNQIYDECMNQLGEYLLDNEHLEILDISFNYITDTGFGLLSEYLIGNTSLKVFYLSGNREITDESVPYLLEIAKESCITSIALGSTSISDEKKQEIYTAFSCPIEQREIPIKSNTKSAAKISAST